MPKIFLTGSGNSKGYVTGSGILNNPVRTIIRDRDNRTGTYPTIHRMNRKGNAGILSNAVFDDTKTVKFGNGITDDFTIGESNVFTKAVNNKHWLTSSTDILIRKEFDPRGDFELTTGAVVLAGPPDGDGRWLQTNQKVGNPTLTFSLLQGPYNNTGALAKFRLNLGEGKPTDVFKVQISITGSSWTDVPLKNIHLGTNDVWSDVLIVNENSKHVVPRNVFELRRVLAGLNIPNVNDLFKPVLNFKLDMKDFAETGIKEPFYIRFIQPSVSDNDINVWAIGHVDITSRDEQVTYPFLGTGDVASNYHKNQTIATPNFINSIVSSGSSISGITDSATLPFNSQPIQPFNEDSVIDINNSGFYSIGTREDVTPGFSSPLTNKTKFEIDLSPYKETDLGLINQGVFGDKTFGNQVMAYWNNSTKTWQKIGKPLPYGISALRNLPTYADTASVLTSSAVGFGADSSIPLVSAPTQGSPVVTLNNRNALSAMTKPIDTFCFPFGPQYHATGSQTIKAKDIGITKPFILEKTELNFDIKIELPKSGSIDWAVGSGNGNKSYLDAFSPNVHITNSNSKIVNMTGSNHITPSFFILRQSKDNFVHERTFKSNRLTAVSTGFKFSIPGHYSIASGTSHSSPPPVFVDTTRDLITFKTSLFNFEHTNYTYPQISHSDIRTAGIPADHFVHVKLDHPNDDSDAAKPTSYTGSNIMQSEVKLASPYTDTKFVFHLQSNNARALLLGKESNNRNYGNYGIQRSLANNISSFTPADSFLLPDVVISNAPTRRTAPNESDVNKTSPYIIYPSDELIFGWQYPLPKDTFSSVGPGPASGHLGFHKMTLFGNSKLILYGSQVKDGKEFHEGLNQNLTSNAIHEVIGSEPVVDQFDLASHGELTGSMSDSVYWAFYDSAAGPIADQELSYAVGSLITPSRLHRHANSFQQTQWRQKSSVKDYPKKRLGGIIGATGAGTVDANMQSVNGLRPHTPGLNLKGIIKLLDSIQDTSSQGRPVGNFIPQIQRFNNINDIQRSYFDSEIANINVESNYGSSQNYTFTYTADPLFIAKLGGSPKYYFDRNNYGQFSNFIRQGFDTRYLKNTLTVINNLVTESPIRVRFVEDSYDEENLNFRKFSLIKPGDIDNTAYETFQSSNISLFATSSLPFKEGTRNSVSDDVPRNRTYSPAAVEVT